MNTKQLLSGPKDPSSLIEVVQFKREFKKEYPDYFEPDGIICFCGPQGAGKTISAVQYVTRIAEKYPKSLLVTNVQIYNYPNPDNLISFSGLEECVYYLQTMQNGFSGVVYLIDEMHLLFNSLESKNIDPSMFTEVAQQRKQRKHIVGTSQVFQRLAKPFREQFKFAVLCRCFFGSVQFNTLIDGQHCTEDSSGHLVTEKMKRYFWFHRRALYETYDTYAKIEKEKLKEGAFEIG